MSAKSQHNNILLAIAGFVAVIIIVALIGFFALDREPNVIQGQVEVSEYRVSSKVPGRIVELRVKEGDYVKAGDTVAILDAPEVRAKIRSRGLSQCYSRQRPASRLPRSRTTASSACSTRVWSLPRSAMRSMPTTRRWRRR